MEREGEVGGDPVRSTDPEVILWGLQILRCQGFTSLHKFRHAIYPCTQLWAFSARLVLVLGVERPESAPDWCLFWALNAHLLPIYGVERQNHSCSGRSAPALLQGAILAFKRPDAAHFGRSAPEPCSVLALNAIQMLLTGV